MRFDLTSPTTASLAAFFAFAAISGAADATSPLDPAARNTPYAPAASVAPDKRTPAGEANSRVQDRRFETTTVDRALAPIGDRRAAIDVGEARAKQVREKTTQRPETIEHRESAYNHRPSAIATGADTTKPPLVAKYQDSLSAATASNMARFPALDRSTSARINRFVFRKNAPEPDRALAGATITPAAGGASPRN